ncbi:hypothetical protein MMC28_004532 [Mycoblastus sanguinarius]|nr:hypothetical protein [Mycoblastus sanguinarius]
MESKESINGKSISPGFHTFSLERIESVLHDDTFVRTANLPPGLPSPLLCQGFDYTFEDGFHRYYSEEEQSLRAEEYCVNLYNQVRNPEGHVAPLDRALSELVVCNFQLTKPTQTILDGAFQLLSRLPAGPLELPDLPSALPRAYFTESIPSDDIGNSERWQKLHVTRYLSTNTIRAALLSVLYPTNASGMLANLVDTIAGLLEVACRLSSKTSSELTQKHWFVVRAFLWTSWQRCGMIYFSNVLDRHLIIGFNDYEGQALILRGTFPATGLSIQEMSRRSASVGKADYMCAWAFELLRSDPVCIGSDFRRFHQRYSEVFGTRPGRCIPDAPVPCKGDHPDSCQRFKGMTIHDQSAHDCRCSGDCQRLAWDERSYRSVSGARAVSIDEKFRAKNTLEYCEASDETLAISHVWSHGQGGRPEEPNGFNRCLHDRYTSIAKASGCDSYWMDTPCIPEEHELRAESISNINKVFEQSKVVLVCDRDVMDIDITNLSLEIRESLLVTVMVCDWNLRAWTFLEAFRGRDSIYLLCKDNTAVSLKETVDVVRRYGSIDIALFLLTVPHLLPSEIKRDIPQSKIIPSPHLNGFLSLETGGSLLSHRAASRPGDDVVIWSLLLGDNVFNDAESFWRSRENNIVWTSFLVSSAPRLNIRGLGWAPSSPTAQLIAGPAQNSSSRLLSYDGTESEAGTVTRDGFKAKWLIYEFNGPRLYLKVVSIGTGLHLRAISSFIGLSSDPEKTLYPVNMHKIRHKHMNNYRWGALLRPINNRTYNSPVQNRGDSTKILVVVCATNVRWHWRTSNKDDRIFWEWRGVYEWDMTEPLPKFTMTPDVILV